MAAKAAKFLALAAEMALHFVQRFGRVHHGKAAVALHLLDLFEDLDEFLGAIAHQAGIAKAQIAGTEGGQRIAKGATFKAEFAQEWRKLVIIFDELAGSDAGGGLDTQLGQNLVGPLHFFADVGKTAIFFVAENVV